MNEPTAYRNHFAKGMTAMQTDYIFDWTLSQEIQTLKTKINAFALKHINPIADEIDKNSRFPRELWPLLGDLDLLATTVSKEYGGTQLGYLAQAVVMEVISRYSASIGLSYGAHANLCMNQIARFGTESQKQKFLPPLASGKWIGALAMSEKEAGSDVLNMQLRAVEKSDFYVLNGHKMWITNGPDADVLVVYAKTNPDAGAHGISVFLIEKDFPGFRTADKLDKLGMRGSNTAQLIFEDCLIPKENLLGERNQGLSILMSGLDYERAILAAGPLGIMQACMDLVLPYVNSRQQFQRPLASFEMVQEKIANLYTRLQATRSYVYQTARACDEKKASPELAASAYLFAAENATQMALDTIQCLGGNGYLNSSPAGRLLRDAKLYEIGAGTTEIRRLVIARALTRENTNEKH